MTERVELWKQYRSFVDAHKTDEAIAAIERLIAADRQILANLPRSESTKKMEQILRTEVLRALALRVHERLAAKEWTAAAARQGELADMLEEILGKTHYTAIKARSNQVYFQTLASLKPEEVRGAS